MIFIEGFKFSSKRLILKHTAPTKMNAEIANTCISEMKTGKMVLFWVFYSAIETDLLQASGEAVVWETRRN
jgi:hypothetical protein